MAIMSWVIWVFFPPAVVSIILLSIPWPVMLAGPVRYALRAVMYGGFFTINFGIVRKVCLAHFLFIGCILGLAYNVVNMRELQSRYREHRDQSAHHGLLERKFAAERNVWIMAFATSLYLISFQLWWLSGKLAKLQERTSGTSQGHESDGCDSDEDGTAKAMPSNIKSKTV